MVDGVKVEGSMRLWELVEVRVTSYLSRGLLETINYILFCLVCQIHAFIYVKCYRSGIVYSDDSAPEETVNTVRVDGRRKVLRKKKNAT